jgi:hypothetical protein
LIARGLFAANLVIPPTARTPASPLDGEKYASQLLKEIVFPSLPAKPQLPVVPPMMMRSEEPLTFDNAFIASRTSAMI